MAVAGSVNGVSLALSDNITNSLYVKHIAAAASLGTDSGGAVAIGTNGFTTAATFDAAQICALGYSGANAALIVTPTASQNRAVTITGSNGANPTIGTSGGSLTLAPATGSVFAGGIGLSDSILIYSSTSIPAGGTSGSGFKFSSTSNFGVFFGSGAPTLSAAKGSLYLRSDGSTTNDRMYVNTNGSTTWTAVTTAA